MTTARANSSFDLTSLPFTGQSHLHSNRLQLQTATEPKWQDFQWELCGIFGRS